MTPFSLRLITPAASNSLSKFKYFFGVIPTFFAMNCADIGSLFKTNWP